MVTAIDSTTLARTQEEDLLRSGALAALPQVQPPAPVGNSLVSTIASAESFSKMSLDMYRDVEAMSLAITQHSTEQLKVDNKQQEALHKQKTELVKQELEAIHSQENWNKVASALEYVGYLAMLVTSQHAAQGYARTIVQLSAAIGLANRFGADTGISESVLNHFVKSKQTQEQVQTTLRVAALVASLAGLFATWHLPSLDELVKSMDGVTKATSIATAGTKVGQKWADRRRAHVQADLSQINTSTILGSQQFQQQMQGAQQGHQTLKEANRSMKGILANAEIHPLED
jgi:hypothetical protein